MTTKNGFYLVLKNSKKVHGGRLRTPTAQRDVKTNRFKDPFDNLLYAILLQAATDSKGDKWGVHCKADADRFLQSETARDWWEYLKTRPMYE